MTSIFRRIDDFLFDRVFQPFVDRFPDQGPVGVARVLLTFTAASFFASGLVDLGARLWIDAIGGPLWLFCAAIDLQKLDALRLKIGVRNIRRLDIFSRFLMVTFCLLLVPPAFISPTTGNIFYAAGMLLYACFEYASACDARPPKTRKAPFWHSWFQPALHGA